MLERAVVSTAGQGQPLVSQKKQLDRGFYSKRWSWQIEPKIGKQLFKVNCFCCCCFSGFIDTTEKAIRLSTCIKIDIKNRRWQRIWSAQHKGLCQTHSSWGGQKVIYTRRGFLWVCVKKKWENPQLDKSNYIYRNSFNLFISWKWLAGRGANGLFRDLLLFSFLPPRTTSFLFFSFYSSPQLPLYLYSSFTTQKIEWIFILKEKKKRRVSGRRSDQRDANTPWRRLFLKPEWIMQTRANILS